LGPLLRGEPETCTCIPLLGRVAPALNGKILNERQYRDVLHPVLAWPAEFCPTCGLQEHLQGLRAEARASGDCNVLWRPCRCMHAYAPMVCHVCMCACVYVCVCVCMCVYTYTCVHVCKFNPAHPAPVAELLDCHGVVLQDLQLLASFPPLQPARSARNQRRVRALRILMRSPAFKMPAFSSSDAKYRSRSATI